MLSAEDQKKYILFHAVTCTDGEWQWFKSRMPNEWLLNVKDDEFGGWQSPETSTFSWTAIANALEPLFEGANDEEAKASHVPALQMHFEVPHDPATIRIKASVVAFLMRKSALQANINALHQENEVRMCNLIVWRMLGLGDIYEHTVNIERAGVICTELLSALLTGRGGSKPQLDVLAIAKDASVHDTSAGALHSSLLKRYHPEDTHTPSSRRKVQEGYLTEMTARVDARRSENLASQAQREREQFGELMPAEVQSLVNGELDKVNSRWICNNLSLAGALERLQLKMKNTGTSPLQLSAMHDTEDDMDVPNAANEFLKMIAEQTTTAIDMMMAADDAVDLDSLSTALFQSDDEKSYVAYIFSRIGGSTIDKIMDIAVEITERCKDVGCQANFLRDWLFPLDKTILARFTALERTILRIDDSSTLLDTLVTCFTCLKNRMEFLNAHYADPERLSALQIAAKLAKGGSMHDHVQTSEGATDMLRLLIGGTKSVKSPPPWTCRGLAKLTVCNVREIVTIMDTIHEIMFIFAMPPTSLIKLSRRSGLGVQDIQ